MNATPGLIRVVINPISAQFEALQRAETVGVLTYERVGAHFDLQHTFVAREHRGRGVADELISGTLDAIRSAGGTVTPSCSRVRSFVKGNPSYDSLVHPVAAALQRDLPGRSVNPIDLNRASFLAPVDIQVHQIITRRMILRPWSLDDIASAVLIYRDKKDTVSTPTFLGPVRDVDAMHRRLDAWITESSSAPHPQGCWAIELSDSGFVAGGAALLNVTDEATTRLVMSVDLSPACVGQGLAAEAGRALAQYAFKTSAIPAVHAMVQPEDKSRIATLTRIGMFKDSRTEREGTSVDWYEIARDELHLTQDHRTSSDTSMNE